MLLSRNSKDINLEYFKMLARAGWQAIDLNETKNMTLFLQNKDIQLDVMGKIINNINNAGLYLGQCHAPMIGSYAGIDSDELDTRAHCIENCIKVANYYKIPFTVVHPLVYSWREADPTPDKTHALNIKLLSHFCSLAENTVICLENMPGKFGFIRSGEDLSNMINDVSNGLCVCFDTGHAASNGLKASEFFASLGDKIKVLHVHDSILGVDKHFLPYTGVFDWADFKASLNAFNYKGNLNSESSFTSKLPQDNLSAWEEFECTVFKTLI